MALVRRCHLLLVGTDLAWKEQRSDSPATKIRLFRCLERRLTAPPHTHTLQPAHPPRTKSKRAVGQSASVQLRPVGADLLDGSQRVQGDWEGGEVVGWRGGGGTKPVLNDGTRTERLDHMLTPLPPVCSETSITFPHLCPWARGHPSPCISLCLPVVDMTRDRLRERRPSR